MGPALTVGPLLVFFLLNTFPLLEQKNIKSSSSSSQTLRLNLSEVVFCGSFSQNRISFRIPVQETGVIWYSNFELSAVLFLDPVCFPQSYAEDER